MGQKYVKLNKVGLPIAFYDTEINQNTIPQEAIPITDEQWLEFISNQGRRRWNFETNSVVEYNPEDDWTLDDWKQRKLQEIAYARWREETIGVTLPDGTVIKTDRESQALLTGAALAAMQDPNTPIEWKGVNGWVVLTPQQILEMASIVRQHVQACFSKEKRLTEKIMAATTIEELEAIKWEVE